MDDRHVIVRAQRSRTHSRIRPRRDWRGRDRAELLPRLVGSRRYHAVVHPRPLRKVTLMTQPMPPVAQDPSILTGRELRALYLATVQRIRDDLNLTEVAQAEQVVAAWEATNTELVDLYRDLQARR